MADLKIPELALVVLVGPSGSGKSTFAGKHFKPTEVLSSDWCRGLVSDRENDLEVTNDAFDVLHFIARKRLALGKLTVGEDKREVEINRTTTVEIKEVGTTKVKVPEEAKKKLT